MKNVQLSKLHSARPTASRDCRQCTTRRIRCDRSVPQCRKCEIRNLSCPGYHALELKWQQGPRRRAKTISQSDLLAPESGQSWTNQVFESSTDANTASIRCHSGLGNVLTLGEPGWRSPVLLTKSRVIIDEVCADVLSANLLGYFEREVAPRLVWIDGEDNPWRTVIRPLAQHASCVNFSLMSLAASHMSATSLQNNKGSQPDCCLIYNLREAGLKALSHAMRNELKYPEQMTYQKQVSKLNEMMATTLILSHDGMFTPESTEWQLHLRASRAVIEKYFLDAQSPPSPVTDALIKEIGDLEVISSFTSFESIQQNQSIISESLRSNTSFWNFTRILRQVTEMERRLHDSTQTLIHKTIDIFDWKASLEHAVQVALLATHCILQDARRKQFESIIRAHHHACLIYCHRALAKEQDQTKRLESVIDDLFFEIQNIASAPFNTFAHDIFWPLFIAGTESTGKPQRQSFVEGIFTNTISATGFWCNDGALKFLRIYWEKSVTEPPQKWIDFARYYQAEIGPFLVF